RAPLGVPAGLVPHRGVDPPRRGGASRPRTPRRPAPSSAGGARRRRVPGEAERLPLALRAARVFDLGGSRLAMCRVTMSEPLAGVGLGAGTGTRMRSETARGLPPVLGQPLAAWPGGRALALGCNPVVAVVGHQGEHVRAALDARFPGQPLRFAT